MLLSLLLIWVLGVSFFSVASPQGEIPSSQTSSPRTGAQSPGKKRLLHVYSFESDKVFTSFPHRGSLKKRNQICISGPPIVQVVLREDLNKKILIALIVSSTLLCVTLVLLLYLFLWRYRYIKNSFTGINPNHHPGTNN